MCYLNDLVLLADLRNQRDTRQIYNHQSDVERAFKNEEQSVDYEPEAVDPFANLREAHLAEWEVILERREEKVRKREEQLARHSQVVTETSIRSTPTSTRNHISIQELAPRTMGLRDIIEILPEFDPDNRSTIDAQQFAESVTMLKNAYGWGDGLLVLAVQAKLRGNAKTWSDTQREIPKCWNEFAADLVENFPNLRHEADVHIEMASTRRNVDESLGRYYHRMCSVVDH